MEHCSLNPITLQPNYKWYIKSTAYDSNGDVLRWVGGDGKERDVGQISTNSGWAKHDMKEHFKNIYDALYPNGWYLIYEYGEDL